MGNQIYETVAEDQKRVQLEMGGKNTTVVMPNADVAEAVSLVGHSAF